MKNKYYKNVVILLSVLVLSITTSTLRAQIYPIGIFDRGYYYPHVSINAGYFFNHKDFFFNFGGGFEDTGYDYGASFNIAFRPYFKKVMYDQKEDIIHQYHEKLFLTSIDLEKRFYFLGHKDHARIGLYTAGKFGYLFGNYRGISKSLTQKFLISPDIGLAYEGKAIRFSLGYVYLNTPSDANNNMIQMKLTFFINNRTLNEIEE